LAALADDLAQREHGVQHDGARRIGRLGLLRAARPLFDFPQSPEFLLGLHQQVAVGFPQRLGRFAEGMILAELVGHLREDLLDREADGLLRVADHAQDGQPRGPDGPQQPR
jgi:hypothetical protein